MGRPNCRRVLAYSVAVSRHMLGAADLLGGERGLRQRQHRGERVAAGRPRSPAWGVSPANSRRASLRVMSSDGTRVRAEARRRRRRRGTATAPRRCAPPPAARRPCGRRAPSVLRARRARTAVASAFAACISTSRPRSQRPFGSVNARRVPSLGRRRCRGSRSFWVVLVGAVQQRVGRRRPRCRDRARTAARGPSPPCTTSSST